MARNITFTYDGKDYTLAFTRRTIEQMERNGFRSNELSEKPMTMLPELFAGAFLANHRFVKQDVIDDIYDHMGNKQELIAKLVEMYTEPIEALLAEPEEGNVSWGTNW